MINSKELDIKIFEEEKYILASNSPALLSGKPGLALFYLHKYQKTNDLKFYIKYRSTIINCVKQLGLLKDEISLFTGPLGVYWLLYLGKLCTKYTIYKTKDIDSQINEYLSYHLNKAKCLPSTLDYIYGHLNWFIIYPYLSISNKLKVIEVYKILINKFDGEKIFSRKVLNNKESYPYKKNCLGFSHGFSSVLFISNEYSLDDINKPSLNIAKQKLDESISKKLQLSRYYESNDFKRQEWCHGNIGLLTVNTDIRDQVLELYFSKERDNNNIGMCHGEAHRILLYKIYQYIYKIDKLYLFKPKKEKLRISENKFNFFESAMIYKMAIEYNHKKDFMFTWWRMFYPINYD